MKTIALFGGSFDPPHKGHEAIVKELLALKYINKVVVMPTYLNPFKSNSFAPSTMRLKWLKNIFALFKNVEISSFEVDLEKKVPSIQSVQYLLKSYKKVYLVIGADNLTSLSKWTDYDELNKLVTFIVASRDNIEVPNTFLKLHVEEDISSTDLRKKITKENLSEICSDEIIKFYKEKNEH